MESSCAPAASQSNGKAAGPAFFHMQPLRAIPGPPVRPGATPRPSRHLLDSGRARGSPPLRRPLRTEPMGPPIEPEEPTALLDPTLVLNRSWCAVHVTTVRRALGMLCRGSVAVLDPESLTPLGAEAWLDRPVVDGARAVRTPSRLIPAPEIVLLGRYDRLPVSQAPFTRISLLRRDDHRCQYCGTRPPRAQLTIDHVVPKARGGRTSWENCVAACVRCNSRKGDRPPSHVGLRLLRTPRAPRWTPCFQMTPGTWPESWRPFLPDARRPSTGT